MSTLTAPLFDPAAYARDVEAAAATGGWSIFHLSPCASGTRPWFQRRAQIADASTPRVYLSTGIHGDEIAGPLAVLELLQRPRFFERFDTTIFPILNPDGLARDQRTNLAGIDLNRDYRNTKSPEIASHIEALKTLGPFSAAVFLHEDYDAPGAYLYELNDLLEPGLGAQMIAAMGRHVPIDQRPEIEEVRATGGVLQRKDLIEKFGPIEERPEWPEAIYFSLNHCRTTYTTETPKLCPLPGRIAAQIAAVEVLLESVWQQRGIQTP